MPFVNGKAVEIGDYGGIGEICVIQINTVKGREVMMAPEVHIVAITIRLAMWKSQCAFKSLLLDASCNNY